MGCWYAGEGIAEASTLGRVVGRLAVACLQGCLRASSVAGRPGSVRSGVPAQNASSGGAVRVCPCGGVGFNGDHEAYSRRWVRGGAQEGAGNPACGACGTAR